MVAKNTDNIQALWDDISALTPQDRTKECEQFEKNQPEILKFMHEELDGYDAVYSEHNLVWLLLTFRALQGDAAAKKKVPKIRIKDLHARIDQNEARIGADEVDEFCDNFPNGLLKFLVDQIHHIEPKSSRKASDMTDEEEDFGDEEGVDHDMEGYEPEEEGDEDYLMFREMYEEHDDHAITDEELEMDEEAKYTLFLVFKSVIDTVSEAQV
jgi:hypothetical protein